MSGLIAPFENVAIQTTLVEPADTVNVQEGDHVTKGQLLAQLDTADLQAELQSDIATAQSDAANTTHTVFSGNESITQGSQTLNAAQASLERDQVQMQRDGALYRQGYVSLETYQADQATVRNDEATLKSDIALVQANGSSLNAPGLQQSSVAQAQAQEKVALAQAQQMRVSIAKASIVSPIDGVVVNRNLNPGEYPGSREIFHAAASHPDLCGACTARAKRSRASTTARPATVTADDLTGNGTLTRRTSSACSTRSTRARRTLRSRWCCQSRATFCVPAWSCKGRLPRCRVAGVRVPITAFTDDNHDALITVQSDDTVKTRHGHRDRKRRNDSVVSGVVAGIRIVSNGQSSVGDGEKISYQP